MSVVRFKNFNFKKDKNIILKNVNFDIKENSFNFLLGEASTGKSLILNTISTLESSYNGNVEVFNKDISLLKKDNLINHRKNIGLLFQNNALFSNMNNIDNLLFPLRKSNLEEEKKKNNALKLLAELQLYNIDKMYPEELSGGMKKRLALARAIIHKPKLILLDDPLAGLDPMSAIDIYNLIRQKLDRQTVIFSTQRIEFEIKKEDNALFITNNKLISGNFLDMKKNNKSFSKFL